MAYEYIILTPAYGPMVRNVIPRKADSGPDKYGGERTENPRHVGLSCPNYFHESELARYVGSKKRRGSNDSKKFVDFSLR